LAPHSTERIGDEANLCARADAPAPPIAAQHGLAVDLEDGWQALPELPAILAIARRPAGAAQERRHGLARPRLGARDLKAGHHEMPDDGGRTRSAAIAARARLRHWQRRMFLQYLMHQEVSGVLGRMLTNQGGPGHV
jgi:hypothetical protein